MTLRLTELSKITSNDSSMISIFNNRSKTALITQLKKIGERVKNIKDAFKRSKMQSILGRIFDYLEENTLPNTCAIFSGLIASKEILEVVALPSSLTFLEVEYYCDYTFRSDLILEMLHPSEKIGIVLVSAKQTTLYEFNFDRHNLLAKITLPKKGSKGTYIAKIKKKMEECFSPVYIISHIVVGPGALKGDLPGKKMDSAQGIGIDALRAPLEEYFIAVKYSEDIAHLEAILNNLEQPLVVYGIRDIAEQIEYKQVKILYCNRLPKIPIDNCRIVHIPKQLKELRLRLKQLGGAVGWKYF